MRGLLLIICCIFILTGCKNNNKATAGIIPQNKMQAILWDMMRADQFLAVFVLNKDSSLNKTSESIKFYNKIFDIHHITKEQFSNSFSYYKTHPDLFKLIMDSLSQIKAETPAEMVKKYVRPDSFQHPLPETIKPDTIMSFPKKKIIPVN
jgi:hypothetical protein